MQTKLLGSEDGRQLAADLLRELQAQHNVEECFLVDGSSIVQNNVARVYLEALIGLQSEDAVHGFAAVLTDFIASAYDGAVNDPELYDPSQSAKGGGTK